MNRLLCCQQKASLFPLFESHRRLLVCGMLLCSCTLCLAVNSSTLRAPGIEMLAGLVFACVTYVLLLGAGKDPVQFMRSLVPSRARLGAPPSIVAALRTMSASMPVFLQLQGARQQSRRVTYYKT